MKKSKSERDMMKNRSLILFTAVLFVTLFFAGCGREQDSPRDKLVGKWYMDDIYMDSVEVSEEHNPFNERNVIFKEDGTFESDGRPYGKNSGRWELDNNNMELFLDSDAGEGDDSYWIISFPGDEQMLWKGTNSGFTERFEIRHRREKQE